LKNHNKNQESSHQLSTLDKENINKFVDNNFFFSPTADVVYSYGGLKCWDKLVKVYNTSIENKPNLKKISRNTFKKYTRLHFQNKKLIWLKTSSSSCSTCFQHFIKIDNLHNEISKINNDIRILSKKLPNLNLNDQNIINSQINKLKLNVAELNLKLNELNKQRNEHYCNVTKSLDEVNSFEKKNLTKDTLVVLFDFKQPIVIPNGKFMSQNDYLNSGKRSITTFGVIIKDTIDETKTYKYCYLSESQFSGSPSWQLVQSYLKHVISLHYDISRHKKIFLRSDRCRSQNLNFFNVSWFSILSTLVLKKFIFVLDLLVTTNFKFIPFLDQFKEE
jgi:hypothetical protein